MGKRITKQKTLELPDEIIGEILIKLPVKSLLKFKCISKSWCSLISSKKFITQHLEHCSTSTDFTHHKVSCSKRINKIITPCSLTLKSVLLAESGEEVAIETLDHHPMRDSNGRDRILGSCNGLVLLALISEWTVPVLWNPSTRESKKIPSPPFARERGFGWEYFKYGFGYDNATDDYKVVCISSVRRPFQTLIYSCRTNSWREIESFPKVLRGKYSGQLVNGRLHWLAEEGGVWDIVSLSLVEEKYEVLPWPENILPRPKSPRILGNLGGCLSLVIYEAEWGMYVWVMKNYGEAKSWTKIWTRSDFVIPESYDDAKPLWLMENGDIAVVFAVAAGSAVAVYDVKNKVCKSRVGIASKILFEPSIYVESLVSPFGL